MKSSPPPKIEELTENIQKVYDVLNHESDLACVLIGASYLSELSGSVIMASMKESNVSKNMLKPDRGAIGGFRARADLAYVLKLINKSDYKDLILISEIRNSFAHKYLALDFVDSEVKESCQKLQACRLLIPILSGKFDGDDIGRTKLDIKGNTRFQFVLSVVMISQRIYSAAFNIKKNKRKVEA